MECRDPSSGVAYWWSEAKGVSTWDDPTSTSTSTTTTSSATTGTTTPPVEPPWVVCDDGEGNTYYFNEVIFLKLLL